MISGLFYINLKGDVVIQRFFRDDVPTANCDRFRQEAIIERRFNKPIFTLDGVTWLYTRQNDMYICCCTRGNVNPMTCFEFMLATINVFTTYFGKKFCEEALVNNFVVIYELLDEMMDNGIPQLTAINHLKGAIALGSIKGDVFMSQNKQLEKITSFITGGVDWREPGKHYYKKNEVFMDVLEAVNVLMASDGKVLRSDVSGKIVFKTYLTGMPQCQFGLNDKIRLEKTPPGGNPNASNNTSQYGQYGNQHHHQQQQPQQPQQQQQRGNRGNGGGASPSGVAIDDITFHRCVSLAQFDQERIVSFIPPDGEFVLMKYRIANNVSLPFTITPNVIMRGRSRVEYDIVINGSFDSRFTALNVRVVIPTPPNAASTNITCTTGKTVFKGSESAIIWKIPRFNGNGVYHLRGEAILSATIEDKPWNKPPINVEFQVPMFTASGINVRFLKVVEASQYLAVKWVRYVTRNGNYQIRI
jgi:AP-2 complex subunit mu-1